MTATTRPAAGPDAPRSEPDVALAGAPTARRLVRDVVAEPQRARRVVVVAPGGHGKTVLLDALAVAYRAAGHPVLRALPDAGHGGPVDAVLIVDDVHLLGPHDVERLGALAAESDRRVVVAHRPWPCSAQLAALDAALAVEGPPLVLGALDRNGVAARAALVLRERPPVALVDRVSEQTAGLPGLVDRLLAAILDQVGPAGRARLAQPAGLPDGPPDLLVAQLGHLVHGLEPRLREFLGALALGAPRDAEVLVPLLGLADSAGAGVDEVDELGEQARAAGFLTVEGALPPLLAIAISARTPTARRLELRRTLAEIELDRGGSVLGAAHGLLETGATGARAAEVFTAGADEAVRVGSRAAGVLYAAAVAAGAPALELATRRAEAAMLAGHLDLAMDQADQVLSAVEQVEPEDAVRAGAVAAAVLAHRGLLARSAELYRWMRGAAQTGTPILLAVPALIGTGALDEARELLAMPAPGPAGPQPGHLRRPPTLQAGAEELMAKGVYDSVAGSATAALSQLARAAGLLEPADRSALLTDTPAALAALVAVHCGELDVAQSVLERAVHVRLGGRVAGARHRLLLGWIALYRGATTAARTLLSAASPPGVRLEPRDELLAAALEVALARRVGDLASLMPAWDRAREAIVRHPVDLFVLQPLGELAIAATRLREPSWVRPHLAEAATLLGRLGHPALWSAPLHWSQLHASILAEDRDAAARHAAALGAAAAGSRYAAAMATAAPHWVRLMDSDVDPEGVEAAARGLHAVGLSWEGGKLVGQAAIRTRDRKAMSALLSCARAMQGGRGPGASAATRPAAETDTPPFGLRVTAAQPAGPAGAAPAAEPEPGSAPDETGDGPLSGREREVAVLVLEGLTYKQIGERLFISAKTVEHHVARMRQRLGSNSRGELFGHLRQILGSAPGD